MKHHRSEKFVHDYLTATLTIRRRTVRAIGRLGDRAAGRLGDAQRT